MEVLSELLLIAFHPSWTYKMRFPGIGSSQIAIHVHPTPRNPINFHKPILVVLEMRDLEILDLAWMYELPGSWY